MAYLRLPDGTYFKFDDALSDQQAQELAQRKFPDAYGIKPQEGLGAAFKKGAEQFISSGGTGIRSIFGDPAAAAQQGLAQQQDIGNRYADQIGFDRVRERFNAPDGGFMSAAGEVARQIPLAIAEQAPNITASVAGAKAGAMAGTAAAPFLGPLAPAAPLIGGGIGALLPSAITQLGGNVVRQQQETPGQIDMDKAVPAALAMGALDAGATFIPLGKTVTGKILGPKVAALLERGGTEAAEKLARETLLKTVGKGLAVGAAAEIPTEITQQMLERFQAGLPLTTPDALKEYSETAYQTGLLAPIGAAGRFVDRSAAKSQVAETERANAAKRAAEAAKAEAERRQTPEYLQDLTTRYDAATQAKAQLDAQIKELQASLKTAPATDKRDIVSQIRQLKLQQGAAANELKPLQLEYDERLKGIQALKEQQRLAGMDPMEVLVGEQAPQGVAPDTSFVDMAQAPVAPAQPAAQPDYLQNLIASLEDPNAAAVGESTLDPREVVAALAQRPDLAQRLIFSPQQFPGTQSKAESNLWKKELAKQVKAGMAEPAPQEDSTAAMNQIIADREMMDREALAEQMGQGREQAFLQRRRQEELDRIAQMRDRAAAEQALIDMSATPEEVAAYRAGTLQPPAPQQQQPIDEALMTPSGVAQSARTLEGAPNAQRPATPQPDTPLATLLQQPGALDAPMEQLALAAANEGSGETAANIKIEPVEADVRRSEIHDDLVTDLYAQLDELARGIFFKSPELEKRDQLTLALDPKQRVRKPGGEWEDAQGKKHREKATTLESSMVRKAVELRQKILNNMLQEAQARRQAAGLPGLTQTEALRASLDLRSAIDALIDQARRVDDSAIEYQADPKRDRVVRDSYGYAWVQRGGIRSVSEQQQRANEDPVYGQVRAQRSFTEAAQLANKLIQGIRAELLNIQPKLRPIGPKRKAFDLAPQTEERLQATERRARGDDLATESQRANQRIENMIDRIEQALAGSVPSRESAAVLAKARQFLLSTTEGTVRRTDPQTGELGAFEQARLTTGAATPRFLDAVDAALDRVNKGLPVEPDTGRAIIEHINSIEQNRQDERMQPSLFEEGDPLALRAKDGDQFQRMLDSRRRSEGPNNPKFTQWLANLNDNIARSQAQVESLESTIERMRKRWYSDEDMAPTLAKVREARGFLASLQEQRTVLKSLNKPELDGNKSSLVREVRKVNEASTALQKALAQAEASVKKAERAAVPLQRTPVEPRRGDEAPSQPKAVAPGTTVVKQTVETPDMEIKRGRQEYTATQPTWDPDTGEYVEPVKQRVIRKNVVETPEQKREALKAKIREQMEDRARQKKLRTDLKLGKTLEGERSEVPLSREASPEERAATARAVVGASRSKGEQVRKNIPSKGKGAPETKLRVESKERESNTSGVDALGRLPDAKPLPPKNEGVGKPAGSPSDVGAVARLRDDLAAEIGVRDAFQAQLDKIEKKSGKEGPRAFALKTSIAQQNKVIERLSKQLELSERLAARKKKFSEGVTGGTTPEVVKSDVASLFSAEQTGESVVTAATADALPPSVRKGLPKTAKAVFADGTVYLIADRLLPGEARGVVLHEAGVHGGMDAATVERLHAEIERLAGEGDAKAKAALQSQEQSSSEDTRDEAVAHYVEMLVNSGVDPSTPPGGLGKFMKVLADAVKKALAKLGLRDDRLTPQDFVDFAYGAAKMALEQRNLKPGTVSFSQKLEYAKGDDAALQKLDAALIKQPTPIMDAIKANILGFRTQFIDRLDPLEKIASAMGDSLKATQMMYWARMYGQRNNFMAEVSSNGPLSVEQTKRADGRVEYMVKSKSGASLQKIAEVLRGAGVGNADAVDARFKTYLIAERAERTGFESVVGYVPKEVTQEDLKKVLAYGRSNEAFQKARKMYQEYNDGLIDFAVQTGALSEDLGKLLKSSQDYVSFYRKDGDSLNLIVDGEKIGTIGSLKNQPYLQELVGGDQQITGFFDGALRNTHLLTDMALRNITTRNTANTLQEIGLAKIGKGDGPAGKTTIRFREHGQDRYAVIDTDTMGIPSELVAFGMEGIATQLPAAFRMLGVPARLLRHFIVRNPVYAFRQVFRDSVANVLMTGATFTPVVDPMKNMVQMMRGKSDAEMRLQERGVVGGQVLTGDIEDRGTILKQLQSGQMGWRTAMAKLDFLAMQADAASRVSAYNSFRQQGLSDMEATLATLETMNFNRRGVSPTVHALNTMIPFFNAQIQGLDVLYRAMKGRMPFSERLQVKRKLYTRGLMIAASTMMYAALMQDDEDYKNASAEDRYNNWFVPIPGTEQKLRVPIPFEPGYIFKSIPEAVFNTAFGDESSRNVLDAFMQMGINTIPGVIPQGVKPLIEAALNRNFFTGREIEDVRMQGLKMAERYGDRTTDIAKALGGSFEVAGREIGVSPAMIEHLVRGYTGALGMAIMGLSNALVQDRVEKPTRKLNETPVLGAMFLEKDASGAVTEAYKQIEAVGKVRATFEKLVKEGREEEAMKFAERYAGQIAKADLAAGTKKQLGDFTKLEQAVRSSDLSADEKREYLDEIRQAKIALSRLTSEALRGG